MKRSCRGIWRTAPMVAVLLAGCGSSEASPSAAPAKPAAKVLRIALKSIAVHGDRLPAAFTCDGKDISPPLSWGTVPSTVEELALFALGTADGKSASPKVEWAMAGIAPQLHSIAAGQTPEQAFVLPNSNSEARY